MCAKTKARTENERGLVFDLCCPYFACFRQPTSTSVILTYPVPPFTTLGGLIACALGRPRNDFTLQKKLQIGIRPLHTAPVSRELAKVQKLTGGPEPAAGRPRPSSPMYRYFLSQPAYRVYLLTETKLLSAISSALCAPKRPLYLGQSDDMVAVDNLKECIVAQEQTTTLFSLAPGVHGKCELLKLPLKFTDEDTLVYSEVLSLPSEFPCTLDRAVEAHRFGDEAVWLAGDGEG